MNSLDDVKKKLDFIRTEGDWDHKAYEYSDWLCVETGTLIERIRAAEDELKRSLFSHKNSLALKRNTTSQVMSVELTEKYFKVWKTQGSSASDIMR